jgi:predicted flap endonuclease-1-like 5' DNA nuclease
MGYLLTQMFLYMLGAFLLGLLLGWIIWHRRDDGSQAAALAAARADAEQMRRGEDALRAERDRLKAELALCSEARLALQRQLSQAQTVRSAPAPMASAAAAPMAAAAAVPPPAPRPAPPVPKPAPVIDDLKKISGIGRVNEAKLNGLGITSFAQIAEWTPADEERFGEILAFEGRIEREEWVRQAKILARGGATEFSQRVERGEVDTSK